MPSKKPAVTTAPPATALIVVGKVGDREITMPSMDKLAQAAKAAVEQYKGYVGAIDSEEVKMLVNAELQSVVKNRNELKRQLAKITDPLTNIRRDALSAMREAENLCAPTFAGYDAAERILKTEMLRWNGIVEQKQLAAEAESQRKADEERQRLEEAARKEAEEAEAKNRAEQERAAELERQGKEAEAEQIRQEAAVELEQAAEQVQMTLEAAEFTQPATVHSESIPTKGTAITGTWLSEVVDVTEVLAGIVAKTTPIEAVRIKIKGRLQPMSVAYVAIQIEGIEINLPWFAVKAREEQDNFAYRGMRAYFKKDVRVTV
jgi:hypothetical protein